MTTQLYNHRLNSYHDVRLRGPIRMRPHEEVWKTGGYSLRTRGAILGSIQALEPSGLPKTRQPQATATAMEACRMDFMPQPNRSMA